MARREERRRHEAVARRLGGEPVGEVARGMGRSRQWVTRWVKRYDPTDPDWARERSHAARTVANRTPAAIEAQVLELRARLVANPWAQIGAEAIAWELEKLRTDPPTTRTIERILVRGGAARRSSRERPPAKGVPYPAPPCEAPGDLHQADLVGPRHLDGGEPFIALNMVDIAAHAGGIEITPDEREQTICGAFVALWERHGVPRRLQLDNGKPFILGGGTLGEVVRLCLHQGATPVFIPQGEPWRNGVVEHYNDTFDKRFFRSERFDSRERLRARASEFERFHNENHRYRATGRRTPAEVIGESIQRKPASLSEPVPGWPEHGRVEFIRFIRSDRKLKLLRRQITMPEHLVYRYVIATLDLSIPATEENLLVHHEGEIVARSQIPIEGRGRPSQSQPSPDVTDPLSAFPPRPREPIRCRS